MSHEALKPKHGITPLQIETSTVATTPMKSLGEASNFNQGTWHLHSKTKMMLRVSSIPACKRGSSPPALVCPSRKPMQPWWMESLRQSRGVVISTAMTCCTTQNAAWSMSQSILSIVLFLVMFWTWRDNKQMQFFRRFFPAPRGNKFSDGTFECTATAVRAVARHVWIQLVKLGTLQFPSAKRRQCHGGHNLRSWPCHFIQLPSRNISIKLNNLRSNKCSYGYHGSQQIRIVPHELWSGNSFPIPLF